MYLIFENSEKLSKFSNLKSLSNLHKGCWAQEDTSVIFGLVRTAKGLKRGQTQIDNLFKDTNLKNHILFKGKTKTNFGVDGPYFISVILD